MQPPKVTRNAGHLPITNGAAKKPAEEGKKDQQLPQCVIDRWETVSVSDTIRSESRNLASRLPFISDIKRPGEQRLQYTTGSNPQPGRVMFTEIETPEEFVGELYRQNGQMVFEPAEFPKGQRLLFSRESFHQIFRQAVKDLEKYPDC